MTTPSRSASSASSIRRPALVARRVPPTGVSPGEFEPTYVTRGRLTRGEFATAAGIGAGLALVGFYLAKLWLERDPVLPPVRPAPGGDASTVHRTITPQRAAT